MSSILQDVRFSLRSLIKDRLFTVVAVLTLAIGIGVNTAVFSVVSGIIWYPVPTDEPGRVATIWSNNLENNVPQSPSSVPDLAALRDQSASFESVTISGMSSFNLVGDGPPETVPGLLCSPTTM